MTKEGGAVRSRGPSAALLLLAAGAALLAACDGSPGGAATLASPSPSPSRGSAPLTGSAREAVTAYWRLVDSGDRAALVGVSAPGAGDEVAGAGGDIAAVKVLRVDAVRSLPGGGTQAEVDVRITPAAAITPWGETGPHTLFVNLVKAPHGGWLVAGWGTGP
jgi:hypothetical protein